MSDAEGHLEANGGTLDDQRESFETGENVSGSGGDMDGQTSEIARLRGLCEQHGIDPNGCEVCFMAEIEGRTITHTVREMEVNVSPRRLAALEALASGASAMIRDGHPCSAAIGLSGEAADGWFKIIASYVHALD